MALDIQSALGNIFRDKVTTTKISPSIKGKSFLIYGGNSLGKTTNAVKFPNPIVIPCERGLSATTGANVLKTGNYTDVKNHIRTLVTNRQMLELLKDNTLTVIIDGVDSLGLMCQRWLCNKYEVTDISEGKGGYGLWGYYEKEMANLVNDLTSVGYTLIFITHQQEDKNGYITPKGDKRTLAPIQNACDITGYLTSNGVDENGRVIPSSLHLAQTDYFFARCRFPYIETHIPVFSAENLIEAVRVGIEKQIEVENAQTTDFNGIQEIYSSSFNMTFDEAISAIREQYMTLQEMDKLETFAEVVEKHLGETPVSEAKPSQLENLQGIYEELAELIG